MQLKKQHPRAGISAEDSKPFTEAEATRLRDCDEIVLCHQDGTLYIAGKQYQKDGMLYTIVNGYCQNYDEYVQILKNESKAHMAKNVA